MSDSTAPVETRATGIREKIPKGYQGNNHGASIEPGHKTKKESHHQDHDLRAGRLAAVPIEELVYYANQQRREYDMHSIKTG